jgi:uncharacterized protein YpbB
MDRLPHFYGLEILQQESTALQSALELAQSEWAKALYESSEALRVASFEGILQIQQTAEAISVAAAVSALQIQQIAEVASVAAELALQIQCEMGEVMRLMAEPALQIQREVAKATWAAAESALRIQLEVESKRIARVGTCYERDQVVEDAVQETVRMLFAFVRLRRLRGQEAQIRRLLRLAKNRILIFLRRLCRSTFPADLILIQKAWFLSHGEHPPKLLAAAIPVCS